MDSKSIQGGSDLHHILYQNFIYKWDRSHSCSVTDMERTRYEASVQLMFK